MLYAPPPNVPFSVDDVVDAIRILLDAGERRTFIPWRSKRWYDDKDLARQITRATGGSTPLAGRRIRGTGRSRSLA